MALNTSLVVDLAAALTGARDLGNASASPSKKVSFSWASGTAANQADVIFADTRTVTGSATDSLDLIGGGLTDSLGTAFAPAKIKAILIVAAAANPNTIQVVRPAATGVTFFLAASDGIALPPGGVMLLAAPGLAGLNAVATGTTDLLSIINTGAGDVIYDIIIVGASA